MSLGYEVGRAVDKATDAIVEAVATAVDAVATGTVKGAEYTKKAITFTVKAAIDATNYMIKAVQDGIQQLKDDYAAHERLLKSEGYKRLQKLYTLLKVNTTMVLKQFHYEVRTDKTKLDDTEVVYILRSLQDIMDHAFQDSEEEMTSAKITEALERVGYIPTKASADNALELEKAVLLKEKMKEAVVATICNDEYHEGYLEDSLDLQKLKQGFADFIDAYNDIQESLGCPTTGGSGGVEIYEEIDEDETKGNNEDDDNVEVLTDRFGEYNDLEKKDEEKNSRSNANLEATYHQ